MSDRDVVAKVASVMGTYMVLRTSPTEIAQRLADAGLLADPALTADEAYRTGNWCGECRYGVVEDPPCCTGPHPALTAEVERLRAQVARVDALADQWGHQAGMLGAALTLRACLWSET